VFIAKALENSDRRIAEGKTITPYFLLSAFLWESVQSLAVEKMQQGEEESFAFQHAASEVLSKQVKSISIPKRVTQSMREVWLLQLRFTKQTGGRPYRLLAHPRFRAAYDFLLLRAETGGAEQELADWWTRFQVADEAEQKKMTRPRSMGKNKRKGGSRTKNNNYKSTND
ncbi:MAG: polynucleotide adenylyltransferase PcnB, partial [Methylomarinum sp.]|nr:polynucleotide adenylyltransferase PcnB [Methylomarinum sp.]